MHRTKVYGPRQHFLRFGAIASAVLAFAVFLVPIAYGQSTGGVKGRVRTQSGIGIAGASVAVRQNGADIKTAVADDKGSFVIDGLEPGSYNIAFEAKGYSTAVQHNVEIKKGKPRDLGDRLILSVDRGSKVIVRGSVFFKNGTSAGGSKVEIYRVAKDGSEQKLNETTADYMGDFGFVQPEGAAKLRLKASYMSGKGTSEVLVDSAMVYRLSILLDINRDNKP